MRRKFAKTAVALLVAASMLTTPVTSAFWGTSVVEAAQERTGQGVDIVDGYLALYDVADTTSGTKTGWVRICDTKADAEATKIGDTIGFTLERNGAGVLEYIIKGYTALTINAETDAEKYVAYHFEGMTEGEFLTVRVGDLLGISSEGKTEENGGTGDESETGGTASAPAAYTGMGIEYVDGKVVLYANDYNGTKLGADAATLVKAAVKSFDSQTAAEEQIKSDPNGTKVDFYELSYNDDKGCWYLETTGINVTAGKWLVVNYYFQQGKVKDGFAEWQIIDTDLILAGKSNYTVEHYEQEIDGSYPTTPARTETLRDYIGAEVTAIVNLSTGFEEDTEEGRTVKTGTVAEDGTLTLKLYYKRGQYNINYNLDAESQNGAENPSVYMYGVGSGTLADPTRPNSVFEGWYTTKSYADTEKVTEVSANSYGNVELYPKWRTTATYTVNRYFQNMDQSTYPETPESEILTGNINSTISSADVGNPYNGFTCIGSKTGTPVTATIDKDNTTEIDIYYTRKDYEITYKNVDGIDNTNPASYVYGESFELTAPGKKENSVFEGWYDTADFSGSEITTISALSFANMTLYANWRTTATYTTEYYLQKADLSGYTKVEADTATATGNIGATVEAKIKEYVGYKNNSNATGSVKSGVVSADNDLVLKVYYDRVTYTVGYEMNGGTNSDANPEEYTYDTGIIQLEDPVREGYIFEGWYEDENCTGFKVSGIDTTVTENRIFYANWTQNTVNPDSITLSETTLALKINETAELTATILPENATDTEVTYTSTEPSVATVDENGLVTALTVGKTDIMAVTRNGKIATCQVTVREAVTAIELEETEVTLEENDTYQLMAVITPENATITDIEWTSEDESIVTVSENGLLTAVSVGTTTITATTADGGYTATCEVTVTERTTPVVPVEGISLNKTEITLAEGATETLVHTFEPEAPTNMNVTWESSDEEIAFVSASGVVKAVAEGTATITVTTADGGYTAVCEVTVEKKVIEVTEIVLSETALELPVGDEVTITATVLPSTATDVELDWSSSDPETVFVDKGVVTALKSGYAVITAETANGVKAECIVTVTETEDTPIAVESVKLDKEFITLTAGMTDILTATVLPTGAVNKQVSWSTDNPGVATVVNGVVTAVSAGNATITVTTAEGNKTATCAVNVPESVKKYTLTFNSAGGSAVAAQSVVAGKTAVMPGAPTRTGYIFAGWYNGATVYNFATPVNGNLVLTARWNVAPVKVTTITLSGISKKIAAGKKIKLTADVAPANASNKALTWTSSNENYATVDAYGTVSVKNAGKGRTVTITAMAADGSGVFETYTIKIMKKPVKKIVLKTSAKTVKAGKQLKVKATVSPSKDVNNTLLWTSSNTNWATVTKNGVIKTKKAGKGKTVKITAMATDGSNKKKTIKIKIK